MGDGGAWKRARCGKTLRAGKQDEYDSMVRVHRPVVAPTRPSSVTFVCGDCKEVAPVYTRRQVTRGDNPRFAVCRSCAEGDAA